jgi:hypothetical protein
VTFTATVAGAYGGGPVATVMFFDGDAVLGKATVSAQQATLIISTLGSGSHNITASFAGGTNFTASSSAVLTQTVN